MISWQRPTIKPWIRAIAFFTCFVFTFTSVVWDGGVKSAQAASPVSVDPTSVVIPAPLSPLSLAETPDLPEGFGTVKKTFKGTGKQIIVAIQDAHVNEEAQRNIANILRYYSEKYQLGLVNLEGASGELYTDLFSFFPNQQARKNVADYFLKEGRLTGPEYLAIVDRPVMQLYGVEDPELYEQNRQAYVESLSFKGRDEEVLVALNKVLEYMTRFVFSEEMRELVRRRVAFQEGGRELVSYVRFLTETAKKHGLKPEDYKGMNSLIQLVDLEKQIDFDKAEKETDDLINDLKRALSPDKLSRFLTNTVHYRMKKMKRAAYYAYLEEEIKGVGVTQTGNGEDLKTKYANVLNYIRYMKLYDTIDVSLFDEIEILEKDVKNKLYTKPEELKLDHLLRIYDVMSKMFDFLLTKQDAEFYYTHQNEFKAETFASFLKPLIKQYHFSLGLPSQMEILDQDLPRVERFYQAALERDQVLIERAVEKTLATGQKISAIVTGGFHTPGIEKYLQEKGLSYIVVAPRISKAIDKKKESALYDAALRETPLPIEKVLSEAFLQPKTGVLNDPRFQLAPELGTPTRSEIREGKNLERARAEIRLTATECMFAAEDAQTEYAKLIKAIGTMDDEDARELVKDQLAAYEGAYLEKGNKGKAAKLWLFNGTRAGVIVRADAVAKSSEVKVPGARQGTEIPLEGYRYVIYPDINVDVLPANILKARQAIMPYTVVNGVVVATTGKISKAEMLAAQTQKSPGTNVGQAIAKAVQTPAEQAEQALYESNLRLFRDAGFSVPAGVDTAKAAGLNRPEQAFRKILTNRNFGARLEALKQVGTGDMSNETVLRFLLRSSPDLITEKVRALREAGLKVNTVTAAYSMEKVRAAVAQKEEELKLAAEVAAREAAAEAAVQKAEEKAPVAPEAPPIVEKKPAVEAPTAEEPPAIAPEAPIVEEKPTVVSEVPSSVPSETTVAEAPTVQPEVAAPGRPALNNVLKSILVKYEGKPLPEMKQLPRLFYNADVATIIARIKAEFGYDDEDLALLSRAAGFSEGTVQQWWYIYGELEKSYESVVEFRAAQRASVKKPMPAGLNIFQKTGYFLWHGISWLVLVGPHLLDSFFFGFYRKKIAFHWFRSSHEPLERKLSLEVLAGAMINATRPNMNRVFLGWKNGTLIERGIYYVLLRQKGVVGALNRIQYTKVFYIANKTIIEPIVVPTLQFVQRRWKLAIFSAVGIGLVALFLPVSFAGIGLLGPLGVWLLHATAGLPILGIVAGAFVKAFTVSSLINTGILSFLLTVPSFSRKYTNIKYDDAILGRLRALNDINERQKASGKRLDLDYLDVRRLVAEVLGSDAAGKTEMLRELQAILPYVRYHTDVEQTLLTELLETELKSTEGQRQEEARAPPQSLAPAWFNQLIVYPLVGVLRTLASNPFSKNSFYSAWAKTTWGMMIVGSEIALLAGGYAPGEQGAAQYIDQGISWVTSRVTGHEIHVSLVSHPVLFVEHNAINWGHNLLSWVETHSGIEVSSLTMRASAAVCGILGLHTEAGDLALNGWSTAEIANYQYAQQQVTGASHNYDTSFETAVLKDLKENQFKTREARFLEMERINLSLVLASLEPLVRALPQNSDETAMIAEQIVTIRDAIQDPEMPLRGDQARLALASVNQMIAQARGAVSGEATTAIKEPAVLKTAAEAIAKPGILDRLVSWSGGVAVQAASATKSISENVTGLRAGIVEMPFLTQIANLMRIPSFMPNGESPVEEVLPAEKPVPLTSPETQPAETGAAQPPAASESARTPDKTTTQPAREKVSESQKQPSVEPVAARGAALIAVEESAAALRTAVKEAVTALTKSGTKPTARELGRWLQKNRPGVVEKFQSDAVQVPALANIMRGTPDERFAARLKDRNLFVNQDKLLVDDFYGRNTAGALEILGSGALSGLAVKAAPSPAPAAVPVEDGGKVQPRVEPDVRTHVVSGALANASADLQAVVKEAREALTAAGVTEPTLRQIGHWLHINREGVVQKFQVEVMNNPELAAVMKGRPGQQYAEQLGGSRLNYLVQPIDDKFGTNTSSVLSLVVSSTAVSGPVSAGAALVRVPVPSAAEVVRAAAVSGPVGAASKATADAAKRVLDDLQHLRDIKADNAARLRGQGTDELIAYFAKEAASIVVSSRDTGAEDYYAAQKLNLRPLFITEFSTRYVEALQRIAPEGDVSKLGREEMLAVLTQQLADLDPGKTLGKDPISAAEIGVLGRSFEKAVRFFNEWRIGAVSQASGPLSDAFVMPELPVEGEAVTVSVNELLESAITEGLKTGRASQAISEAMGEAVKQRGTLKLKVVARAGTDFVFKGAGVGVEVDIKLVEPGKKEKGALSEYFSENAKLQIQRETANIVAAVRQHLNNIVSAKARVEYTQKLREDLTGFLQIAREHTEDRLDLNAAAVIEEFDRSQNYFLEDRILEENENLRSLGSLMGIDPGRPIVIPELADLSRVQDPVFRAKIRTEAVRALAQQGIKLGDTENLSKGNLDGALARGRYQQDAAALALKKAREGMQVIFNARVFFNVGNMFDFRCPLTFRHDPKTNPMVYWLESSRIARRYIREARMIEARGQDLTSRIETNKNEVTLSEDRCATARTALEDQAQRFSEGKGWVYDYKAALEGLVNAENDLEGAYHEREQLQIDIDRFEADVSETVDSFQKDYESDSEKAKTGESQKRLNEQFFKDMEASARPAAGKVDGTTLESSVRAGENENLIEQQNDVAEGKEVLSWKLHEAGIRLSGTVNGKKIDDLQRYQENLFSEHDRSVAFAERSFFQKIMDLFRPKPRDAETIKAEIEAVGKVKIAILDAVRPGIMKGVWQSRLKDIDSRLQENRQVIASGKNDVLRDPEARLQARRETEDLMVAAHAILRSDNATKEAKEKAADDLKDLSATEKKIKDVEDAVRNVAALEYERGLVQADLDAVKNVEVVSTSRSVSFKVDGAMGLGMVNPADGGEGGKGAGALMSIVINSKFDGQIDAIDAALREKEMLGPALERDWVVAVGIQRQFLDVISARIRLYERAIEDMTRENKVLVIGGESGTPQELTITVKTETPGVSYDGVDQFGRELHVQVVVASPDQADKRFVRVTDMNGSEIVPGADDTKQLIREERPRGLRTLLAEKGADLENTGEKSTMIEQQMRWVDINLSEAKKAVLTLNAELERSKVRYLRILGRDPGVELEFHPLDVKVILAANKEEAARVMEKLIEKEEMVRESVAATPEQRRQAAHSIEVLRLRAAEIAMTARERIQNGVAIRGADFNPRVDEDIVKCRLRIAGALASAAREQKTLRLDIMLPFVSDLPALEPTTKDIPVNEHLEAVVPDEPAQLARKETGGSVSSNLYSGQAGKERRLSTAQADEALRRSLDEIDWFQNHERGALKDLEIRYQNTLVQWDENRRQILGISNVLQENTQKQLTGNASYGADDLSNAIESVNRAILSNNGANYYLPTQYLDYIRGMKDPVAILHAAGPEDEARLRLMGVKETRTANGKRSRSILMTPANLENVIEYSGNRVAALNWSINKQLGAIQGGKYRYLSGLGVDAYAYQIPLGLGRAMISMPFFTGLIPSFSRFSTHGSRSPG